MRRTFINRDQQNGRLYVIRGSHKMEQPIRGIGLPFPYEEHRELIENNTWSLQLKAGEALFFHTKMIHGSPENSTDKDRPAIVAGLIPEEARPILYWSQSLVKTMHFQCKTFSCYTLL
ncbi:MAG: phytanoyl-CoA dioxygenase family protein [Bacteroidetes bacterium]|nr:phytanoyl-CoA dioxygenase family protein [Bacteroidota bacterium]